MYVHTDAALSALTAPLRFLPGRTLVFEGNTAVIAFAHEVAVAVVEADMDMQGGCRFPNSARGTANCAANDAGAATRRHLSSPSETSPPLQRRWMSRCDSRVRLMKE